MTPRESAFLAGVLAAPDDDVPRLVYADWLEEHGEMVRCWKCAGQRFPGYFGGDSLADAFAIELENRRCDHCHGTGRVSDGRAERAEFIRVQCELARPLPVTIDDLFEEQWLGDARQRVLVRHQPRLDVLRRREWELLGQDIHLCIHCDWHHPIPHGGWEWTFRRGFVESVTCPLSDWDSHGAAVISCHPVREVLIRGYAVSPVAQESISACCLALARHRLALDSRTRGRVV